MPPQSVERLLVGQDPAEAALLCADAFVDGIRDRPAGISVALAGGSTPALLHGALAQPPYRERAPWREIHWFWGDERTVPPDHADSNYRMAMETLLGPLGVSADRIHRMPAERPDREQAAAEYEQEIRRHVPCGPGGIPELDVVFLGVGTDGHTASLFPGSAALDELTRLVAANYAPGPNAWRMTMTYPLLRAARHILLFVTGDPKAEIMGRILMERDRNLPATALRDAAGQVTWVLDAAAARLVHRPLNP